MGNKLHSFPFPEIKGKKGVKGRRKKVEGVIWNKKKNGEMWIAARWPSRRALRIKPRDALGPPQSCKSNAHQLLSLRRISYRHKIILLGIDCYLLMFRNVIALYINHDGYIELASSYILSTQQKKGFMFCKVKLKGVCIELAPF